MTNIKYETFRTQFMWVFHAPIDYPISPRQGDAVRFGCITGLALEDMGVRAARPNTTLCYFGPGVAEFYVHAGAGGIDNWIMPGDPIFFTDYVHPSTNLNKDLNGILFGISLGAVAAGYLGFVEVMMFPAAEKVRPPNL